MDVYPSIPLKNGLNTKYYVLNQRVESRPSTEFLLLLTNDVLTPADPNYANLFMGKFELDLICNNNSHSNCIKS